MKNPTGFKSTLVISLFTIIFLSGCMGPMAALGIASLEQKKAAGCETLEKDLRANKKNKEVDIKWGMINKGCKDYYQTQAQYK